MYESSKSIRFLFHHKSSSSSVFESKQDVGVVSSFPRASHISTGELWHTKAPGVAKLPHPACKTWIPAFNCGQWMDLGSNDGEVLHCILHFLYAKAINTKKRAIYKSFNS